MRLALHPGGFGAGRLEQLGQIGQRDPGAFRARQRDDLRKASEWYGKAASALAFLGLTWSYPAGLVRS